MNSNFSNTFHTIAMSKLMKNDIETQKVQKQLFDLVSISQRLTLLI